MKINQLLQTLKLENKYDIKTKDKEKSTGETILESFKSKTDAVNSLAEKYQVNLTEKDVKEIDNFMKKADGTTDSKLQTLEVAFFKGVEINTDNLDAIHLALNETPDMEIDLLLQGEGEGPESLEDLIDNLKLPDELKSALKGYLAEGKSVEEAVRLVAKQILQDLGALNAGSAGIDLSEIEANLKGVLDSGTLETLVKAVSDLLNLMEGTEAAVSLPFDSMVQNLSLEQLLQYLKVDTELSDKITKGSDELNQRIQVLIEEIMGREVSDKTDSEGESLGDKNVKVLTAANTGGKVTLHELVNSENTNAEQETDDEASLGTSEAQGSETDASSTEGISEEALISVLEAIAGSLQSAVEAVEATFDVKTFIVETITEKSYELQQSFEASKNELVQLTDTSQDVSAESIQKAIGLLEKTMLKSEVTLYTDMHTEKKLLVLSSQLTDAKNLLNSEDQEGALKVVKAVNEALKKIEVNMNPQKLQSFATKRMEETLELLKGDDKEKPETVKQQVQMLLEIQKDTTGARSGRDVLETLRGLGLNHEMEVSEEIATKNQQVKSEWMSSNVKEILMKLMKEESADRSIEETLLSLTGQQMMNDSGQQRQQQFHFFNLPFEDDMEINNMKVYMTGKNSSGVLDANNASLYFGMNLKHYGETGVKVEIKDGSVEMTVLNDNVDVFEAAFETMKDEVSELGYPEVKIKVEAYKEVKPFALQGEIQKNERFTYDEQKGFDFKI